MSSSSSAGSSSGNGVQQSSLDPSIVAALVNIIQTGTSPQILNIQQQLLRRLLLEGDVVPSRLPAPRNITEVGGYINLLSDLGQKTLETEMIASALGVAPPPGLLAAPPGHTLAMISLTNDRPSGSLQPTIPLTWSVRSDFRDAMLSALSTIHSQGGMLPLLASPPSLPAQDPSFTAPSDWLPLIGRELSIVPGVALNDPTTDPVALASKTTGGPYELVSLASGAGAPPPSPWFALKWSGGALTEVSLPTGQFIELAPLLATAGFYPASPLPSPASQSDTTWAALTNVTGLVAGVTTLQSELLLLYSAYEIGASALTAYFHYTWDGKTFS
jgi:hypothetical protein